MTIRATLSENVSPGTYLVGDVHDARVTSGAGEVLSERVGAGYATAHSLADTAERGDHDGGAGGARTRDQWIMSPRL